MKADRLPSYPAAVMTGCRPHLFWIGLALAVALAAPGNGRAQSIDAAGDGPSRAARRQAKVHFVRGHEHYAAGDFRAAINAFTRAYALMPLPELQYNIGRAHEQLGDLPSAIEAFERYLSAAPDAEDAEEVRGRIEWLRATRLALAENQVSEPNEGALRVMLPARHVLQSVTLDGEALADDVLDGAILVSSGRHRLVVAVADRPSPFEAEVTVRAGGLTAAQVAFPDPRAPADGVERDQGSLWPVVLSALGAAAVVTGGVLASASTTTDGATLAKAAQATWVGAAALFGGAACVYAFD